MLVESFALLREHHRQARLVIVGDGDERERIDGLIGREGLADCVEMTGVVDDVARQMARFSCLVLPSAYESSPNVVLEALATGVPVVASPVGDLEETVVDGRTGYLLRDETAAGLASLLARILEDDALRRRAALEGPRMVAEKFSVANAVEKLLEIYQSLCGGG
jgi:glycosyltransferase involved in cell wall biosynthesis